MVTLPLLWITHVSIMWHSQKIKFQKKVCFPALAIMTNGQSGGDTVLLAEILLKRKNLRVISSSLKACKRIRELISAPTNSEMQMTRETSPKILETMQ